MRNTRAFTLTDLLALIVVLSLLLAVTAAAGGPPGRANPFPNYAAIAQAAGAYRNDNQNRLPFTLTYKRGTTKSATSGLLAGWCTWQWAGKNNLGRWANSTSKAFDVEAADRPMNAYLYPDTVFDAPPPPATLPANDPARNQQALINRDPFDKASHQWDWPNSEPAGLSCYIDVGTSYHTNMTGVYSIPGDFDDSSSAGFEKRFQAFNELLAAGTGFNPSRYVWLHDEYPPIIVYQQPGFTIKNGRGDINKSAVLYLDGHAGYESVSPQVFKTSIYTLVYEE